MNSSEVNQTRVLKPLQSTCAVGPRLLIKNPIRNPQETSTQLNQKNVCVRNPSSTNSQAVGPRLLIKNPIRNPQETSTQLNQKNVCVRNPSSTNSQAVGPSLLIKKTIRNPQETSTQLNQKNFCVGNPSSINPSSINSQAVGPSLLIKKPIRNPQETSTQLNQKNFCVGNPSSINPSSINSQAVRPSLLIKKPRREPQETSQLKQKHFCVKNPSSNSQAAGPSLLITKTIEVPQETSIHSELKHFWVGNPKSINAQAGSSSLVLHEQDQSPQNKYEMYMEMKRSDFENEGYDSNFNSKISPFSRQRWSEAETLSLITAYKQYEPLYSANKWSQAKLYKMIAQELRDKGYTYDNYNCKEKMDALKKKYREVKDHNTQSGVEPKTWVYFDKLDEFLRTKPWVKPLSIAGSNVRVNNDDFNNASSAKRPRKALQTEKIRFMEILANEKKLRRESRDAYYKEKLNLERVRPSCQG